MSPRFSEFTIQFALLIGVLLCIGEALKASNVIIKMLLIALGILLLLAIYKKQLRVRACVAGGLAVAIIFILNASILPTLAPSTASPRIVDEIKHPDRDTHGTLSKDGQLYMLNEYQRALHPRQHSKIVAYRVKEPYQKVYINQWQEISNSNLLSNYFISAFIFLAIMSFGYVYLKPNSSFVNRIQIIKKR